MTATTVPRRQQKSNVKEERWRVSWLHRAGSRPPCLSRNRDRCPHVVAFRLDVGKDELRPLPTLTGRQQQPSALAKHSRQPFLCPFGDTSPQPLSSPGLCVMQVTRRYNSSNSFPSDEIESFRPPSGVGTRPWLSKYPPQRPPLWPSSACGGHNWSHPRAPAPSLHGGGVGQINHQERGCWAARRLRDHGL